MSAESKSFEEKLREIFAEALDQPSLEARQRYLETVCAGDAALRSSVEGLLRAHQQATAFLDQNARGEAMDRVTESPGTVIGAYRLIEKLGEGGFGVVYRAEQTKPLSREVALKIIKLGMDTREVIARFEVERQAQAGRISARATLTIKASSPAVASLMGSHRPSSPFR